MSILAEALRLEPFMTNNEISPVHGTSLYVTGNIIQAMHPGWQVIAASNPLPMACSSYFEVSILSNPNSSGGLAVGFCGHLPSGNEVHSIRLSDSVLYNSHNGLIGDCFDEGDVERQVQFREGDVIGVQNDIPNSCTRWFYNQRHIGSSPLKQECLDKLQSMYPVFGLYAPDTRIQVNFKKAASSIATVSEAPVPDVTAAAEPEAAAAAATAATQPAEAGAE